jgi:hypothetical protein
VLLAKILFLIGVVGLLRSVPQFRTMSRALDEDTLGVLKRVIRSAELNGYPPEFIPVLMLLAVLTWIVVTQLTGPFVR